MYKQVFDPVGDSLGLSSIFAVLPILALFVLLGGLRLAAQWAALIALGVAHAVQCPYCIDAYTKTCLEKGSDLEQMTEAVHVASAIRGGASLVHGVQMLEHARHAVARRRATPATD